MDTNQHIKLEWTAEDKEVLTKAAEAVGISVETFIRFAAIMWASQVLARND